MSNLNEKFKTRNIISSANWLFKNDIELLLNGEIYYQTFC